MLFGAWQTMFPITLSSPSLLAAGRDVTGTRELFVIEGNAPGASIKSFEICTPGPGPGTTSILFSASPGLRGFDITNDFAIESSGFVANIGDTGDRRATLLVDAWVYQGVVYLYFRMQHLANSTWSNSGFVLLRGILNQGTDAFDWSIAIDDLAHFGTVSANTPNSEPLAASAGRGADWSISGIWTPYDRGNAAPLVANACVVDYITRGSGAPSDGRVFVERLTRETSSDTWTPSGSLVFEWGDIVDPDGGFIDHFHSAVLLEWVDPDTGRRGLQLIISAGDVGYKNRNIRLTWVGASDYDPTDPAAMGAETSWQDIANWTVTDDYHGDGSGGLRESLHAPFGIGSNQWVGAAQGLDEGTLLVGTDVNSAPIEILDASDYAAPHPVFRPLMPASVRDAYMNALVVRCADPADGSSLWYAQYTDGLDQIPSVHRDRVLYTPDWGNSWLYAPIQAQAAIGNRVYRLAAGKVESSELAPAQRLRPLSISPGRPNAAGDFEHGFGATVGTPQGFTVTRIKRWDDGHFYDGPAGKPEARLPDPPVYTDVITKHAVDRSWVDTPGIANIASWDYLTYITAGPSIHGLLNTTAITRRALARVHVLTTKTSSPSGTIWFNWGGYYDSERLGKFLADASDSWQPFGMISAPNQTMHDDSEELTLRLDVGPGEVYYLAVENMHFVDQDDSRPLDIGYPSAPQWSLSPVPPDEIASVTGFSLAEGQDYLALFATVPWDNWHDNTGAHALATLTDGTPDGDRVTLVFDATRCALVVRVHRADGSESSDQIEPHPSDASYYATFRGAPVCVAVSLRSNAVIVGVNLIGEAYSFPVLFPGDPGAPFGPLTTLKFGADGQGQVSSFDFYGYRFGPGGDSGTELLNALRDPQGIGTGEDCPSACPGDMDNNGVMNLDDINLFASAFVAGSLTADIDDNGVLNLDDINTFAASFIAGCP
ncbi:MAG: GC-type dockerin domain-anchored protein [Phycisphaerales bacterium]